MVLDETKAKTVIREYDDLVNIINCVTKHALCGTPSTPQQDQFMVLAGIAIYNKIKIPGR